MPEREQLLAIRRYLSAAGGDHHGALRKLLADTRLSSVMTAFDGLKLTRAPEGLRAGRCGDRSVAVPAVGCVGDSACGRGAEAWIRKDDCGPLQAGDTLAHAVEYAADWHIKRCKRACECGRDEPVAVWTSETLK